MRVASLALLARRPPGAAPRAAEPAHRTENVVVIVTDGLRWQEVFRGAETALVSEKPGGVEDVAATKAAFWRGPRRRSGAKPSCPFSGRSWRRRARSTATSTRAASAQVVNGYKFSYPGYNEIITGAGDTRIDSNEYGPNPNVSVFEWLNGQPGFQGRVAVVAGWDAFRADLQPRAAAASTCGSAGRRRFPDTTTPRQELLEHALRARSTREFSDMPWDALPPADAARVRPGAGSRASSSSATARPTSGRTTAGTTSSCSRPTRWTASSGSSGRRCRLSRSTGTRRPF